MFVRGGGGGGEGVGWCRRDIASQGGSLKVVSAIAKTTVVVNI